MSISLYALAYAVLGERMYTSVLADSFRARPWGIFLHALIASLALAIGPFQFHRGLLVRRRELHKKLGIIYVACAFLGGGVIGMYMAIYSHGGLITHAGFGGLAAGTGLTTALAFAHVKARRIAAHREWMIRSYAFVFAAVTLRLWLRLLIAAHRGEFTPAYQWVSWLCWVPNALWAEWYVRQSRREQAPAVPELATA